MKKTPCNVIAKIIHLRKRLMRYRGSVDIYKTIPKADIGVKNFLKIVKDSWKELPVIIVRKNLIKTKPTSAIKILPPGIF